MLDERKKLILQAIIEDFIATAEPIGSRTIARKMNINISAATIRNEMADLEHLGFLEQPHTSAGRIPSSKGYRFYVDWLMAPIGLTDKEVALIKKWYDERTRQVSEVFQETVRILSHTTHNVALMVARKDAKDVFRYVEFLPLDARRAIMVVVGKNGVLDNKIIESSGDINVDDLRRVARVVNDAFTGKRVSEITFDEINALHTVLLPDAVVLDSFLNVLRNTNKKGCSEQLFLGGATQLLNQPEFRDVERVRSILNMLDEQKLMCDILHRSDSVGTIITIGHENKFSGISDCSIVQADFRLDDETTAKIAVLGPTRMHYGKIISTIDYMAKYMAELIKRYAA